MNFKLYSTSVFVSALIFALFAEPIPDPLTIVHIENCDGPLHLSTHHECVCTHCNDRQLHHINNDDNNNTHQTTEEETSREDSASGDIKVVVTTTTEDCCCVNKHSSNDVPINYGTVQLASDTGYPYYSCPTSCNYGEACYYPASAFYGGEAYDTSRTTAYYPGACNIVESRHNIPAAAVYNNPTVKYNNPSAPTYNNPSTSTFNNPSTTTCNNLGATAYNNHGMGCCNTGYNNNNNVNYPNVSRYPSKDSAGCCCCCCA